MVGLARSFMIAGTENVGVSLWSISDEATAEFMTRMYRKVLKEGKTFKEAYYQVKSEFRSDPKWSHPLYWAAFVLYE
jgi:CHAT domain-containing protein